MGTDPHPGGQEEPAPHRVYGRQGLRAGFVATITADPGDSHLEETPAREFRRALAGAPGKADEKVADEDRRPEGTCGHLGLTAEAVPFV